MTSAHAETRGGRDVNGVSRTTCCVVGGGPAGVMLSLKDFLAFVVEEAKRYPSFELKMGARVEGLIEEGGVVRGVRYEDREGGHELRAALTVGADGRGSRVRHLGGFELRKTSPPMDILWFRVPRLEGDPEGGVAFFGGGHCLVMLDRGGQWQVDRKSTRL